MDDERNFSPSPRSPSSHPYALATYLFQVANRFVTFAKNSLAYERKQFCEKKLYGRLGMWESTEKNGRIFASAFCNVSLHCQQRKTKGAKFKAKHANQAEKKAL